jgi:uncharacterized protein
MEWLTIGIILSSGSFFHGITGFGFVIFALPFLIVFHEPHDCIIMCTILGMANTGYLALRTHQDIVLGVVKRVFLFSILGLPFGAYFFVNFDVEALKIAISVCVVFFGLLLLRNWSFRFKRTSVIESVVGFLSGFFQMSVGLTGIPPAVYLTLQGYSKSNFRASINAFLLLLAPIALIMFWFLVKEDRGMFVSGVQYVPMVIAGQYLGMKASTKVSQKLFRKIVIFTILGAGLYNVFSVFLRG